MPAQLRRDVCRENALLRHWRILVALRRRAYTLNMLAVKCGCTTRTIRRDLEVLQVVGFPLYCVRGSELGDPVYWKVGPLPQWPQDEPVPVQELQPCG